VQAEQAYNLQNGKRGFMKKAVIVLGVVIGFVVLAIVALSVLANPNSHRERIQAQLEKELGRKVTLGRMSLGFIPLRFQVENPVIDEDPGIGRDPFVRAENLDVRIGLLPLLSGNIQVNSLVLTRPAVELIRTRQGVWNCATLGSKTTPTTSAGTSADSASSGFSLDRLAIVDGQVGITDHQQKQPRTGYDHIDLTLLNYASGKPFLFDLAAHIQGEGAQEIRFKGDAGPVSANASETPFQGNLRLNQVGIDGLMKFLDSKAVPKAEGVLSGESAIASKSGAISVTGKLKLDKPKFNNVDIGYPIELDHQLAANVASGLVKIEKAAIQLGQTPLSLSGSVNTASSPPILDLRIKPGDVSIAEIARLASAFGVAFAPGTTVNGRINADVRARGPANKPELTGVIAGRDIQISGAGVPQPVAIKSVDLALTPTAIQSNEFNATSGKTNLAARFSLLQYASNSPGMDFGVRAPGATLPEIQSIAKAYGVTGLDQIAGEGTLNFDLQAKGPLESLSAQSATKALNGVINLDFSPLRVAGFDTAHELAKVGGFTSSVAEQKATDIVKIMGRILVKNGIAQTDDLRAQLGIGNLAATGTADLTSETLNLKLSAVFTKAFTEKIGTTRAGGLMNNALTNETGELVLPALVTGSFKQPKFAPDLKAVAELQKQKYLPTMDNPGRAITNVLGALKGKPETSTEQPQEKKATGIKGLLDALGKKKPD